MKTQRLRLRYRVLPEASGLNQRELIGVLEAAARATGLALACSEGKRPAAQISLAAPLPQGVTSDGELVDLFLGERVNPNAALEGLRPNLPPGIEPLDAAEIGVAAPSLQSQLRWAEYEAEVPLARDVDVVKVRESVASFLKAETVPFEYRRETKVRSYDLRPLVLGLWIEEQRTGCVVLGMRLRAEQELTGRADQVLLALGLPQAQRIHRRRLHVAEGQPAVVAYRRIGEPPED